ncbi:MAG: LemA family protein [Planctomycetota bacterium]
MEHVMYVMGGVAVFLVVVVIAIYNGLVSKRNMCKNSFGGVDVQLKKRYDLIPNLVECVKGYAKHEAGVLSEVIALRSAAQSASKPQATLEANARLDAGMGRLLAVAEGYPDLKASDNFRFLMRSLNEVEEQIAAARRGYNAAVNELNNAVEMFPSNLVASVTGFSRGDYFVAGEGDRSAPVVNLNAR